jgi:hypothetical protein
MEIKFSGGYQEQFARSHLLSELKESRPPARTNPHGNELKGDCA